MNILFVYLKMFHPYRGGIERVSDILCREFLKLGHSVFFLHSIQDESLMDYTYPAPVSFFPFPIGDIEKNGLFYQNFLIDNHIDIVINQDPLAYHSLCRFSQETIGVHTISVIHSHPLFIYDHLQELTLRLRNETFIEKIKRIARIVKVPKIKFDYWLELKRCYEDCLTYSDALCLLSLKFIPELKRIYKKDLDKIVAIGNPNTYSCQEFIKYSKKKQILYVGRIEWYLKRVDRLVDIWRYLYKKFPEWELVLVGDGPIKGELEKKFAKMERVVFVGYQDPEPFYKNASILCLTSDSEGWGMVLTEAMTFGTIPVAFNSYASITDIIDDGQTGLLVPPFSCAQFADKLGYLINNEKVREEMSEACINSVHRFDIQNVVKQWENCFERLKTGKC